MVDTDGPDNGAPYHYFTVQNFQYKDFDVVDNGGKNRIY